MGVNTSNVIRSKRINRLQKIMKIARDTNGLNLLEKTDEGILKTEDFIEYLEERGAKYVFIRGNDDFIEIKFIDDM